jgi:UPF0176 protein
MKRHDLEYPYRVLLFYKYVKINEFEVYTKRHLKFCKALGVKGRILIAHEGINGTLSGTIDQCNAYIHAMHMDERFADMIFKIDHVKHHAFTKIFVRPRTEIVTLGLENDVDPSIMTGKHLQPKDFYAAMQEENVIVIDGRNDYEYEIGRFRNAIRPPVGAFKYFPDWINKNLSQHKDKKILTYCTGGIRCEKLSAFMLREGFNDVSQLDGGIINYSKDETVKGAGFDGKCYVFDERIAIEINKVDPKIVSKCHHCGTSCDSYKNCANPECNIQHFVCADCEIKHKRSCSKECEEHPRNRYLLINEMA